MGFRSGFGRDNTYIPHSGMGKRLANDELVDAYITANLERRSEQRANSRGTFWFVGRDLYSYHTRVAVFHVKQMAILTVGQKLTPTTSEQLRELFWPCRTHEPVIKTFGVPFLDNDGVAEQLANLDTLMSGYVSALHSIARTPGSCPVPEWRCETARYAHREAADFKFTFGIDVELPHREDGISRALDTHAEKVKLYNSPRAVAKRERAYGRQLLRQLAES